jgi:hypothetical protein
LGFDYLVRHVLEPDRDEEAKDGWDDGDEADDDYEGSEIGEDDY